MPSPYVKNLAKETGKSVRDIEKVWKRAKGIASETLGVYEDDFGAKEYKYTVGIVKNILGVREEIIDPSSFVESDKSAKDFLKEVMISGGFDIGNVVPPEEDEEDEEEPAPKKKPYKVKKENEPEPTQEKKTPLTPDPDRENTDIDRDAVDFLDEIIKRTQ